MTSIGDSTLLGPLTTTWPVPPACTVAVGACSTCNFGWLGQTCAGSNTVQDATTCWPPRTSGAFTPSQPLLAWGVYSPGIACPSGYRTACSYDGAKQTGDFNFFFSPRASETAIGCCPTGYTCSLGEIGQTCFAAMTTSSLPTVTCDAGTSAQFEFLTIPFAVPVSDSAKIISTFTAFAPLFQLNHQASDLPTTGQGVTSTGSKPTSSSTTGDIGSTTSLQTPPTSSPESQGLSAGASAGIGVGVALGAILLGVGAFLMYRSRKRKAAYQLGGALPPLKKDEAMNIPELQSNSPHQQVVAELEDPHGYTHRPY
ncbi:hypothetical protein F5Y04DRAFT_256208 [Hypomontagnella monticulosa]|nr:hypothetical protein F5Y04DRAFT_256208 [Hypomontagnella monticulosa]